MFVFSEQDIGTVTFDIVMAIDNLYKQHLPIPRNEGGFATKYRILIFHNYDILIIFDLGNEVK